MNAEIIAVGTELLLGDIINTNAQYLSKELAALGINVFRQTVVGDNEDRILESFENAFKNCDLIITTGGLGPTPDDLTKEVAAKYFGQELVLHQESYKELENYFKKSNREVTESNKKQAYFPKSAIVLRNNHGTAPGAIFEGKEGKKIIILPGPPKEMKPMFRDYVVPYLKNFSEGVLVSKTIRLFGIGESFMAERIKDIIDSQTNPTIAPYAKEFDVILRITAKGRDQEDGKNIIIPMENKVKERLGEFIYGEGETSLEETVAKLLVEKNITISSTESCTGGMIASKLISYGGISKVFLEGAVTYSNDSKIRRLGVKEETLRKFGAVSAETAVEMAEGIAKTSGSDFGISSTGIAGPTGGSSEKPVGLVYIGVYYKGNAFAQRFIFPGDRNKIRSRATMNALNLIRKTILSN